MTNSSATAVAHPNIALIKYWGNRDEDLRLPANSSLSLTLGGLESRTTVQFSPDMDTDQCWIDGQQLGGKALSRVVEQLDRIRALAGLQSPASVHSENNFPVGAGVASSASGFAALTLAGCQAAGEQLSAQQLSRLARFGSGSAARSIHGGFVLWHRGQDDQSSYAEQVAPPDHWDLTDLIVIVDASVKELGSREGHRLAGSSPLQAARVGGAQSRLETCRQAILARDFERLADIAELDSTLMHAVMMTSRPPLFYWAPATLRIMGRIRALRQDGLRAFYTIDAGPNIHCLCPTSRAAELESELRTVAGVREILEARPGGPARVVPDESGG